MKRASPRLALPTASERPLLAGAEWQLSGRIPGKADVAIN
jgi:hypothetical protein